MSSHLAATVLITMVPGARRQPIMPIMPIMVAKHETLSLWHEGDVVARGGR